MKRLRSFIAFVLCLALTPLAALANLRFTPAATGATAAQSFMPGSPTTARLAEIRVSGTFGGTTVTVQTSSDGGTTWIDTGVSFTAAAIDYVYIVPGDSVRVTCTGGSGISLVVRVR